MAPYGRAGLAQIKEQPARGALLLAAGMDLGRAPDVLPRARRRRYPIPRLSDVESSLSTGDCLIIGSGGPPGTESCRSSKIRVRSARDRLVGRRCSLASRG